MLDQSPGKTEEIAYYSSDAPPLDFSYKNIKNLEGIISISLELKTMEPRQGNRKPIQTE